MPMNLEIITAERSVFEGEVDMVIAPGLDGQLGILPRHAPLMTILKPGELTVKKSGEDDIYVAVSGGFMEVMNDKVVVLAEASEYAEDIDRARVERARDNSEQDLSVARQTGDQDLRMRAHRALSRAKARLQTTERARGV